MNTHPKVSIVIPFHWMKNWETFLVRCLKSIEEQTFTDYEVVLMKVGSMPVTSNRVIESAKGELIKVLYMDDYLAHKDALKAIVEAMDSSDWLINGCDSNPNPHVTEDLIKGNNKLGSPSCLTMRSMYAVYFDENLSWLLDCDLYQRMIDTYGNPKILDGVHVIMGRHEGQMTNILTNEEKLSEHEYMNKKHE